MPGRVVDLSLSSMVLLGLTTREMPFGGRRSHVHSFLGSVSAAIIVGIAMTVFAGPANASSNNLSASCRSLAATAARTCRVSGSLSGSHTYRSSSDDVTATWSGTLMFDQRLPEYGSENTRSYVLASGSRISWQITGSAGGCAVSGGGTLNASQLEGTLVVGRRLRDGVWAWSASVDVRSPQSGEVLMPATCSSAPDLAIGFAKGFQFLDVSLGQPSTTARTDSVHSTGSRSSSDSVTKPRHVGR